jgi:hypothetical protein
MAAALVAGRVAPARAQEPPPVLEPVATLGCPTCDDARALSVVVGLAVRDGLVAVADRDPPHVRVFALDGSLTRVLASAGDGPGEARAPMAVALAADGAVTLVDRGRRRVVTLDASGSERGATRIGFPLAVALAADGRSFWLVRADWGTLGSVLERGSVGAGEAESVVTDLPAWPLPPPGEAPLFLSDAAAPDGGLAIGEGATEYLVNLLDPAGAVRGRIRRDVARRPATQEGTASAAHFSLGALAYDGRGRLWVRTGRAEHGTVFDVFDGTRHLGEVRVAARIGAYTFGEGLLVAAVLDELDVPTIGVWRVVEGG